VGSVNIQFRFEGDHSGERSREIEDQGVGAYDGHIPRIGEGVALASANGEGLYRCRVVDVWTILANQKTYSSFVAVYVRPQEAGKDAATEGREPVPAP
jgi:hypothetical protein